MSAVVFLLITRSMFIGNGGEWWNACFASIKEESSGGSGGWLDIWLLSLFRLFQAMASTAAIIVLLVFVDFWTLNIPRPLHIFVSFNHKKKKIQVKYQRVRVMSASSWNFEVVRTLGRHLAPKCGSIRHDRIIRRGLWCPPARSKLFLHPLDFAE